MSTLIRNRLRTFGACTLALLTLGGELYAQQISVRGRVVNAQTNEVVPGASVGVQGATRTAVTDGNGRFILHVPSLSATIVVSSLGFAQSIIPLNGQSDLVVRLREQAVELEQLVVVGYGSQRKKDITGAVVTVDSSRFQNNASTTIEQAIQGAVPGIVVTTTGGGAEPRNDLVIRGRNSIKAGNDPLIVVDGIPYEGAISEINQADIESINILKDASAAAIYGSRGSNGVLIVTTKRGRGAPRFSYDGYVGAQEVTNIPRLMNGVEFADFKCQRLRGGVNCETLLSATERANLAAGRSTDWVDLATRQGSQQQHNLSVRGGNEFTRYYITGSVLDVAGVARNDDFRRYSARINLDQDVKSWLRVGTNTLLSRTDRSGLAANFDDAFFMNPLTNPYKGDGSTLSVTPWPEDNFWANPLQGLLVTDDDRTNRVFTSNYVELNTSAIPGLSYRFNGGIDYANGKTGRYYGRDTRIGQEKLGLASTSSSNRYDWTAENVLRFQRSFATNHNLDATALFSVQSNDVESESLVSNGFPNDVLTYYQGNLGALAVPGYSVSRSKLVSQMGRLNYSFRDRYLVTATARRDGFSGFGDNHKYGVFPSLAIGWNVINEPFWPLLKSLSMLKVRASYGQNGNQAIRPYQTLARLDDYSYLNGSNTAPGFIPVTLGNPNLRWETTTTANVGIDFGFISNRVQGAVDVYRANTKDLLLDRLISPVHGVTSIVENIGKTKNSGIELQLLTNNIKHGDFSWNTNFNISRNRNRIVELYVPGADDVLNGWFIGQPIDVNYTYKFDGIWQVGDNMAASAQPTAKPGDVRIVDQNGDGKIDALDRTIIGSLDPSYTAGLINTFDYKGLKLSAFFNTVQGITRANSLRGTNLVQAEVRRNTIFREYWTAANPINTTPANRDNSNLQGVSFFEDASFIRLKDLTLSYDLPAALLRWTGGQPMRLYVSGRNLWTHTDWTGLDPELNNQRAIPLERVIIGGLNVNF